MVIPLLMLVLVCLALASEMKLSGGESPLEAAEFLNVELQPAHQRQKRFLGMLVKKVADDITGCGFYPSTCRMERDIKQHFVPDGKRLNGFLEAYYRDMNAIKQEAEITQKHMRRFREYLNELVKDSIELVNLQIVLSGMRNSTRRVELENLRNALKEHEKTTMEIVGEVTYYAGSVVTLALAPLAPYATVALYVVFEALFIAQQILSEKKQRDDLRKMHRNALKQLSQGYQANREDTMHIVDLTEKLIQMDEMGMKLHNQVDVLSQTLWHTFQNLLADKSLESGGSGKYVRADANDIHKHDAQRHSLKATWSKVNKEVQKRNFKNSRYEYRPRNSLANMGTMSQAHKVLTDSASMTKALGSILGKDSDQFFGVIVPAFEEVFHTYIPSSVDGSNWQHILRASQKVAKGVQNRVLARDLITQVKIDGITQHDVFLIMGRLFPRMKCYEVYPLRNPDHTIHAIDFPTNLYSSLDTAVSLGVGEEHIREMLKAVFGLDVTTEQLVYLVSAVKPEMASFEGHDLNKVRKCIVSSALKDKKKGIEAILKQYEKYFLPI